ncbi:MAG: hypothetical protein ACKOEC_00860 [Acidimicrobiia bacterium]
MSSLKLHVMRNLTRHLYFWVLLAIVTGGTSDAWRGWRPRGA